MVEISMGAGDYRLDDRIEKAVKQNSFPGVAGPYAMHGGRAITCAALPVEDYTPPERFMPLSQEQFTADLARGDENLYGTPFTHAAQQMLARQYGQRQQGFSRTPVKFTVNWSWLPPSTFTVRGDDWRQDE